MLGLLRGRCALPYHNRFCCRADEVIHYFGEYTARKGFNHSETNQLILNFKKKMDRRGLLEWRYKTAAIDTAGSRPLTFQYLPQKVALTRTMMIAF